MHNTIMPKKVYHFKKTSTRLKNTHKLRVPFTFLNFRKQHARNFAHLFEKLGTKAVGTTATLSETRRNGQKIDFVYSRTKRGCELIEKRYHRKSGGVEIQHLK
jgi:hypothetical protein